MKAFLLLFIFSPTILFSQNKDSERLIQLQSEYVFAKNYDSLILNCFEFCELDAKIAKENNTDYYLAKVVFC